MVRAIIFASALMLGSVALAQDAPPADAPPAADAAAAPADAAPAPADTAAAPTDSTPAAPAASDASYPPCSAKVQDHCVQGGHKAASHKPAKKAHHK